MSNQQVSAEPPLNLCKELWANLIARVALHTPQTTLPLIVLQQSLAGFFKLVQSLLPCINRVVLPLCQRLPCHIVLARDFGDVEIGVVHSPGRFVDPARRDSRENNGWWCDKMNDKINGNNGVQARRLRGGPWKSIEDE